MNEIAIIKEQELLGKDFKVYGTPEEPFFLAKDVATWIEHSNPRMMLQCVDEDEKVVKNVYTLGGSQESWFLTEDGLYEVLMQSRKPIAKEFKKQVKQILKSIRKHGGYIAGQETMTDDELMAKALLVAQNKIAERDAIIHRQQMQIEADKPKTIFADAVSSSDSSILIRDLAKLLRQNGVKTGEKRLYQWMRENGYIIKNSLRPTQKAMELGLFEISERTVTRGDRLPIVTQTTRVTGKGQMYFINKFLTA